VWPYPDVAVFRAFVAIFRSCKQVGSGWGCSKSAILSQERVGGKNSVRARAGNLSGAMERSFSLPMFVSGQNFDIWPEFVGQRFPRFRRSSAAAARNDLLEAAPGRRAQTGKNCRGWCSRFARVDIRANGRRAGENERILPVTYVEPMMGNEPHVGFDLAWSPVRNTHWRRRSIPGRSTRHRRSSFSRSRGGSRLVC